jgi:hypothetical protein
MTWLGQPEKPSIRTTLLCLRGRTLVRSEDDPKAIVGAYVKGYDDGDRDGRQEALFVMLRARGIPVEYKDQQRILGAGSRQIDRWIARAVTAPSVRELFAREARTATKRSAPPRRGSASAPSRPARRPSRAGARAAG